MEYIPIFARKSYQAGYEKGVELARAKARIDTELAKAAEMEAFAVDVL